MELSSYTKFAMSIIGKKLSPTQVTKRFNKEVEKSDYSKSDKNALIEYLCSLTLKKAL